ncbi:MAG TPA: hypothetical protein DCM71_15780, partial [Runella sp.]|nr:hypothetical protein [Runella sp.]
MKTTTFFSEPITSALGWTLLHSLWQGGVVVLLAAVALFALRKRSSVVKYWVGISGLAAQVVASAATFVLYYQPVSSAATSSLTTLQTQRYWASGMTYAKVALPWYKEVLLFLQLHLDTIVLFWGIGASVLLVRLVGSWVYVQQLKAEGIQLTEPSVQSLFRRVLGTLRIRQNVHLFESVRVTTPMVIGFVKPVVLLPVGLVTGLSPKQIEAVLAHELAHVKRYDYLVNLLQSLVEVVYFFHPALWWLSGRVRQEREHCCDDIAVAVCGDKMAMAKALAEVAAYRSTPALAMAFANKKGAMLHRVKRVLGVTEKPQQRLNASGLLLVLLLVVGVSVYAFQPQDKPKKDPKLRNTSHTLKDMQFATDEQGKLTKVKWKNRFLSSKQVAELQHLKEQLAEGTVALSDIKQADFRAILSRITEVEDGLSTGLSALGNISLDNIELMEAVEDVIEPAEELSEVEIADSILVNGKWVEVGSAFEAKIDEAKMAYYHRQIDSLHRLMEPQMHKMNELRLKMEQYEFQVNEVERKREVLEWKKNKASNERSQILDKRSQLLHQENAAKKLSDDQIEKSLAQYEEQVKQFESQMQQFNKQMAELSEQEKTARKPIEELEEQQRKLEAVNEKFSQEMERYSDELNNLF